MLLSWIRTPRKLDVCYIDCFTPATLEWRVKPQSKFREVKKEEEKAWLVCLPSFAGEWDWLLACWLRRAKVPDNSDPSFVWLRRRPTRRSPTGRWPLGRRPSRLPDSFQNLCWTISRFRVSNRLLIVAWSDGNKMWNLI